MWVFRGRKMAPIKSTLGVWAAKTGWTHRRKSPKQPREHCLATGHLLAAFEEHDLVSSGSGSCIMRSNCSSAACLVGGHASKNKHCKNRKSHRQLRPWLREYLWSAERDHWEEAEDDFLGSQHVGCLKTKIVMKSSVFATLRTKAA